MQLPGGGLSGPSGLHGLPFLLCFGLPRPALPLPLHLFQHGFRADSRLLRRLPGEDLPLHGAGDGAKQQGRLLEKLHPIFGLFQIEPGGNLAEPVLDITVRFFQQIPGKRPGRFFRIYSSGSLPRHTRSPPS